MHMQMRALQRDIKLQQGNNAITTVNEVRDLGLIFDNDLKFTAHVNNIVAKAHSRACVIYKCFISKDIATLKRAFTTNVRPLLEYASCVWSPSYCSVVRQIESVQRQFSTRLPGYQQLNYKCRLAMGLVWTLWNFDVFTLIIMITTGHHATGLGS